jgi:transcriptional regulator with XRE-family HTH domain
MTPARSTAVPSWRSSTNEVEELSADLKAWLQVSGLSYRDTAEMLGLTLNVVHRAATGAGSVSPQARAKLANLLYRGEGWRRIHDDLEAYRRQYEAFRNEHRG